VNDFLQNASAFNYRLHLKSLIWVEYHLHSFHDTNSIIKDDSCISRKHLTKGDRILIKNF